MIPDDSENGEQRDGPERPRVSRWTIFRSVTGAVASFLVLGTIVGGLLALFHSETPLPAAWNPTKSLSVADPVTPLTASKLRVALGDPELCLAVLDAAAKMTPMAPVETSENCHIHNRVTVSGIGGVRIDPVETSCATALRMAMWERHGVQPAATTAVPFAPQVAIRTAGAPIPPPTPSTSQGLISMTDNAFG